MNDNLIINGCILKRTCYACPEQYDVILNDKQFGYLRLRHGCFTAYYPDVGGIRAYSGYPKGDGIFEADERFFFLKEAVDSLFAVHNNKVIERVDEAN
jgi:hypothetical protein